MSTLTISIIQPNLVWQDVPANLAQLEKMIVDLPSNTQLVVLPEMFSTGFSMSPEAHATTMEGEPVLWMKLVAADRKVILTGSLMIHEDGKFFNRLIWMLPTGQFGTYDKRHLFGYAHEHEHYAPGHNRFIASVNRWKVHANICYDLRFPAWSRQQMRETAPGQLEPEYDILMYVANWPSKRVHAWRSLLVARAIENQCYVIGVNRVGSDANGHEYPGQSLIVDPIGNILHQGSSEPETYTITLDKSALDETRRQLPFLNDADIFHFKA